MRADLQRQTTAAGEIFSKRKTPGSDVQMNDPSFRSETDWGLPQVLDVEQFEQSLTDALQGEAEEAADPTEDMTAAPVKGFTLQALFPPK